MAGLGPRLLSVTVKVTGWSTAGVGLSTAFSTSRSALLRGVIVDCAELLFGLMSGWVSVATLATLVNGVSPACTLICRVCDWPLGRFALVQTLDIASYEVRGEGTAAEDRAGRVRSVRVSPVALPGPLLVAVTVNVTI